MSPVAADALAPLALRFRPLRGVEAVNEVTWRAVDDDPQFLVELPGPQAEGTYLIVVALAGEAVEAPRAYLDFGEGWSESTSVELSASASRQEWRAVVRVPRLGPRLRLDPCDQTGTFELHRVGLLPMHDEDAHLLFAARSAFAAAGRTHGEGAAVATRRAGLAQLVESSCIGLDPADDDHYSRWALACDSLDDSALGVLSDVVQRLDSRPLLSLVLDAGNATPSEVSACVDAMCSQLYPDWELLVLDDPAMVPETRRHMQAVALRDRRIAWVSDAVASDSRPRWPIVLEKASGTMVSLIGAKLRLAPHALLAFVAAIREFPVARVLYADVDSIDVEGRRHHPRFRPSFDPYLLQQLDFLHPCAFHSLRDARHVAARLDRDAMATLTSSLAIRCAQEYGGGEVVHVPHILAHVAANADAPDEKSGPQSRQHFTPCSKAQRAGGYPDVLPQEGSASRLPAEAQLTVSIVIPTRDRVDLLRRCIDSILHNELPPGAEIIVVDNQSRDPEALAYLAEIARDARIRVLAHDAPFNYSRINNAAVAVAAGDVVLLLNNDIEVISPDWIAAMLRYASRPDVGAVGAMLYYPDDTIQHAGVVVGLGGVAGHRFPHMPRGDAGVGGRATYAQTLGAVTAACLMVRRQLYLEVGGFDESLEVAFNDVDFCLRLAARGLRNIWTPHAELYHHESASRGFEDTPEKQARFSKEVATMIERWGMALVRDPAYHPLLSLDPLRQFWPDHDRGAGLQDWVAAVHAQRDGCVIARTAAWLEPADAAVQHATLTSDLSAMRARDGCLPGA